MKIENAPMKGHPIALVIVLDNGLICNEGHHVQQTKEKDIYSLTLKNGRTIQLSSPRQIEAFRFLQDKEHTTITIRQLAEHLVLDKDQTRKVLFSLKEKGILYYEHARKGSIKIIRVTDFGRFKNRGRYGR